MAAGTLYSYPENFRAYKILIAAQYSGAKIKVVSESPEFKFGETNKSDIFLKKFPLGKVPAFESDGNYIFESNAIAYYVANDQLRGNSPLDKSHILQWINFADNEILSPTCTWIFPCLGIMQYNKQATQRAKDDIRKLLDVLNNYLLFRTYLVGERITLADITLACNLLHLYQHVMEPSFRESFVNVNRWFSTLIKQPQFKAVIGEVKLCEKMAQFDAKTYAELQSKVKEGGNGSVIEKKEKKKEKKSDKPKEEKEKQEKIVNTEELDLADEVLAAEPKCKDPFEAYPKGTFILDEFKRVYSNEDTLTVAIPYFWKNFDKENYSMWYCEYKYCDELTKIYMSCNLIAGMFQRLEKLRKNAFASMCLFGIDNDSTISGIWIWRGHNLAFELSPDWQVDYESYSFTKLDPDSEDTKKKINEYFAWDGEFGGKQFNQGKIFK